MVAESSPQLKHNSQTCEVTGAEIKLSVKEIGIVKWKNGSQNRFRISRSDIQCLSFCLLMFCSCFGLVF